MATPRPKDVNCLVPPRAKQAKPCYFLLSVSLASLNFQGKGPDIGASLAQRLRVSLIIQFWLSMLGI